MEEQKTQEAVAKLIDVIRTQTVDRDDALFGECIIAIQNIGTPSIPFLRPFLNDSDVVVREFSSEALTFLKDVDIVPKLLEHMTSYEIRDRLDAESNLASFMKNNLLSRQNADLFILLIRSILVLSSSFIERNLAVRTIVNIVERNSVCSILVNHLKYEADNRIIELIKEKLIDLECSDF